jgi:phenylacetic acid degradation operon negative regulatory protein
VRPTAKSLILDLLSTLRGGAMPVRALVAAGGLFGIAAGGVRVELARLLARGLVTRDERGQYRLAGGAEAVQHMVASWGRVEERMTDWTGGWIGAHVGALPRSRRRALRRRERALERLGFRALEPGLWVRPANLRGGVAEVRRQLQALGLEAAAPVFALGELDERTEARARGLWSTRALLAGYRAMRHALERSARRVAALPADRAMVETFLLGGRAIRLLAFDPLLPEPILPGAERRRLVEVMRRYDQAGRQCWRTFMREHGAPSRRSPVDLRLVSGAGELRAAAGGRA